MSKNEVHAIRTSLGLAHGLLQGITAELPPAVLEPPPAGAAIGGVLPILAHAIFGEDLMVNMLVRQRESVLVSGGWMAKTGIPGPIPMQNADWLAATYDAEGLRAYAQAVFEETMRWLEAPREDELARMVQTPLGSSVPGSDLIAAFGSAHLMLHAGEIAALKGVRGVPGGLPA